MNFDKNISIGIDKHRSYDHVASVTMTPTLFDDKNLSYDIHDHTVGDGCDCNETEIINDTLKTVEHLYERKKYEIVHKPDGTLVNYDDEEIRVMCPVDTKWVKQAVGETGNPNMYYMGFRAYAPKGAVSFKEGDQGVIIDEMHTFDNAFAGTDDHGRNYSLCWLALASYDETSDTWTYFGEKSTTSKYIGWNYVVEWYDAAGKIIESDTIRINLANESCYYANNSSSSGDISQVVKEANTYTDEQIAKILESVDDATDEDIENLFK